MKMRGLPTDGILRPDEILCPNDLLEIGFMNRYHAATRTVFPDAMQVVGFDDIPMAS